VRLLASGGSARSARDAPPRRCACAGPLFDQLLSTQSEAEARRKPPAGSLCVKETLQRLVDASRYYVSHTAELLEEHATLRATAFDRQEAHKLVAPRFLASEKAESEANAAPASSDAEARTGEAVPAAAAIDVSDAPAAATGAPASWTAAPAAPMAAPAAATGEPADFLSKLAQVEGAPTVTA
jgi:hypothetical protein